MDFNNIKNKFEELFSASPLLVRSPGRINLIGDHTDYNNGFVLPAAIDKEIGLAVSKNSSGLCHLYAYDLGESFTFDLHDFSPTDMGWPNYIMGVVDQLQKAGLVIQGFNCVFSGDVPAGAGLSSSAALECGTAYALNHLFDLQVDKTQMVKLAQLAEHTFAGVQCGIMDQFASMMGKQNHAMRLDCRSLEFNYFPLDLQQYHIVLCDTQVKHSLASSEYNTRRQECEQGVAVVQKIYPSVQSMRDVSLEMLQEVKMDLSPTVYSRCTFVIEENDRLLTGCALLEEGDIKGFGQKMYGSHVGLSKKYDVSCPELDFLVDFTKDNPAVVGSRMMGGGFGGCTINLVAADQKENFIKEVTAAYETTFGIALKTYEVAITDGTSLLSEEASA